MPRAVAAPRRAASEALPPLTPQGAAELRRSLVIGEGTGGRAGLVWLGAPPLVRLVWGRACARVAPPQKNTPPPLFPRPHSPHTHTRAPPCLTPLLQLGPSSADGGASPPTPPTDGGAISPTTRPSTDPLADVELGLLIGAGAYGRVYRGLWGGVPVAVKVVPHADVEPPPRAAADDSGSGDSGVAPDGTPRPAAAATLRGALELMHSVNLDHSGIVKTYKSAQRTLAAAGGGGKQAAPSPPARLPLRVLAETWLIMEYCDGGNLQDAVDRGVFWARPPPGAPPTRVGVPVPPTAVRPSPAAGGAALGTSPAPNGGAFTPDGSLHGEWPALPPGAGVDPVSPRGGGGSDSGSGGAAHPTLTPDMAAITATAADIAAAMAYLHSLDVLHGDLTGGNVLLCSTGGGGDGRPLPARTRSGDPAPPLLHLPPSPARLHRQGGRLWARQGAGGGCRVDGHVWHCDPHAARTAHRGPPVQGGRRVRVWRAAVGDVHGAAAVGGVDTDAGHFCGDRAPRAPHVSVPTRPPALRRPGG